MSNLGSIINVTNIKRENKNVKSTSVPSLMDATTGTYYDLTNKNEIIIGRSLNCSIIIDSSSMSRYHCFINFECNKYIAYDNNSCTGTYINCSKIPSGKINSVVLNHGDLISFVTDNNMMQHIYKFILPSNADKISRFDNFTVPDILSLNENCKHCITELHSQILDLKVEKLVFNDNVKKQVSEFQKILQDSMKIISEYLNALMSKQECSIESFKTQVYALLDNHFQCSICHEVLIKASITCCNHAFCKSCLSKWLVKSKNCPVCRTSLKTYTHYLAIDNFITDICDLIGGKAKDQRETRLKEMLLDPEPTTKRGTKRPHTRSQTQVTRTIPRIIIPIYRSSEPINLANNSH